MASIEFLQAEYERAFQTMEDTSLPENTRRAARARFRHLVDRIGTMERSGLADDDENDWRPLYPGHRGYSEIGVVATTQRSPSSEPSLSHDELRRERLDKKAVVERAARDRL